MTGTASWAVAMQLGLLVPYPQCRSHLPIAAIVAFVLLVIALVAGIVSWRSPWPTSAGVFTARLCSLISLVFAYALLLQTMAGLMLTGCER